MAFPVLRTGEKLGFVGAPKIRAVAANIRSDLCKVRIKKEVESCKNAKSSTTTERDKVTDLEEKLRQLSKSREREKDNLQKKITYLKDESKLFVPRINADLEKMMVRVEISEKESESLKRQLEDTEQKLSECFRQKRELEHNLSRQTAPTHEINTSEAEKLVKHLHEELQKYANCHMTTNRQELPNGSTMQGLSNGPDAQGPSNEETEPTGGGLKRRLLLLSACVGFSFLDGYLRDKQREKKNEARLLMLYQSQNHNSRETPGL